jgi:hypothetical protein
LSERFPKRGLKKNCVSEYAAMAIPIAVSSTNNSFLAKVGNIGISIPKPSRSTKTVRKIKERADVFFNFIQ